MCCGLEEVAIPSSVTVIERLAFQHCKDLRKVSFREGSALRKIGCWCFSATALEEFVAPPGLREIEGAAFYCCRDLKRVVLNEALEEIRDYYDGPRYIGAFEGVEIREVTLPSTLRRIDRNAFQSCYGLQTIYVRGGCEADLSRLAVYDPTKVYPTPETMLGGVSVQGLREQRRVAIPEGVETIRGYLFSDAAVKSVAIPESVREIGDHAFRRCSRLRRVVFAEGSQLQTIGRRAFEGSGVREIAIPSSVTSLEDGAFYCCKSLRLVLFQEDSRLQRIGEWCFYGCGLMKFSAPQSLREVGSNAFCGTQLRAGQVVFPPGAVVSPRAFGKESRKDGQLK